jgi:hypothetical protein
MKKLTSEVGGSAYLDWKNFNTQTAPWVICG